MPTDVFVYGTLQPGQYRWPVLQPFAIGSEAGASTPGLLFDTGYGWPAAVFGACSGDRVPGFIVSLRPQYIVDALDTLDEVEGVGSGLFRRVGVGVGGRRCWAYHWPASTRGFERIAFWPPPCPSGGSPSELPAS